MDDDELIRDLAKELLEPLGFDVSLARDGTEAIAVYERGLQSGRRIDVLIMDLTVPGGMGGKEAIQALRRIDPGVKAIVSSGYSDDPVMAEYEKYGFAGVLRKPYGPEALVATVEGILTGTGETE